MRETTHGDIELDRAGFGILLHAALERFGRDESMRDCQDPQVIAKKLSECLDRHFEQAYGQEHEPGLVFQRETARERLNAFAPLQAKLVADGWRTVQVEGQLPVIKVKEVEIGGRYDRLDYHAASDTWRVYDYKTYDDLEDNDPQTRHVTELKNANSTRRPGFEFSLDGKTYRWDELQLPVYYHNLRNAYGDHIKEDHKLEVGYVILPSEGPAQALIWEGYAENFSEHGKKAIEAAVARLLSEDPALFAPKDTATKYPTLEHLKGRKPHAYMQTDLLGKVETKPTTK